MSLAIDTAFVTAVLIGGHWFDVEPGSFDLDAYEFLHRWHHEKDGHKWMNHGPGGPGFTFIGGRNGVVFMGPISSIQAVQYDADDAENWVASFGDASHIEPDATAGPIEP